MENKKIDKLLDQVTLGLEDDLEIRLDVTNELRAHLDDKIEEYQATGQSESESEENALKNFGDTIQIADGLIDANISQMKLKARLRKIVGFLLVPTVIICAILPLWHSLNLRLILNSLFSHNFTTLEPVAKWCKIYTPAEELVLYGDRSRKLRSDEQKAIHERFPNSKIYLANYILAALYDYSEKSLTKEKILHELGKAKQLDPDNALYNYLTASLLLEDACEIVLKEAPAGKLDRTWMKSKYQPYKITVKDQKLMSQAVQEYYAGIHKKELKSYCNELILKKYEIMGMPENFAENLIQISISAGVILPQVNYYLSLSKIMFGYVENLQKNGKEQEAIRLAKTWKVYLWQVSNDANYLIGTLIALDVADVAYNKVSDMSQNVEITGRLEPEKRNLKKVTKVRQAWAEGPSDDGFLELSQKKLGMIGGMLVPAFRCNTKFTEKDLAIGRQVEYVAAEKLGISLLVTFFSFGIIGACISAVVWRIRSGHKAMLLAPSLKVLSKILLYAIILPLLAYTFLTCLDIPGGHGFNIRVSFINFAGQLFLLLIFIPVLIFLITRKYVILRCQDLGVPIPENNMNKTSKISWIIASLIIVVIAIFPIGLLFEPRKVSFYEMGCAFLLAIALLRITAMAVSVLYYAFFNGKRYALFYGAISRTLTPVLALAIIVIATSIMPFLNWREADLIKRDKVMFGQPKSFTHVESLLVSQLKNKLLKAIDK